MDELSGAEFRVPAASQYVQVSSKEEGPMMRVIAAAAVVFSLFAIQGCAHFTPPARHHELDPTKTYWLDYDATRRGTLLLPGNTNFKTCAEPSPDVALTLVSKIEGSLEKPGFASVEAKAEFDATVVQLAKRTQMVMFLREAMYRLCEQSLNNSFAEKDIIDTYTKILEAAIKIVDTDHSEAKARATEAQSKAQELKLKMQLK